MPPLEAAYVAPPAAVALEGESHDGWQAASSAVFLRQVEEEEESFCS